MNARPYTPGTSVVDITAPGGIEALLAFHRRTFGDARMDGEADQDAPPQVQLNEHGYPDKTPVKDMTPEQQAAYWRYHSQKHEGRARNYDQVAAELAALKAATQTADEKALEEATTAAADKATAEATARYAGLLVAAEIKAALAGRVPAESVGSLVAGIAPEKFLSDSGEVDTAKVTAWVDALAPARQQKWPDMGQGRRPSPEATGVGAGRDLYTSRHPANP